MSDVFISYSRKDKDFVRILHQALNKSARNTWIDWQDIPPSAEWWKEIQAGIEGSDTFIFVISRDSVSSKVCNQEVEHAVANNKRLLPIVRRQDYTENQLHEALRRHNWLFFRESDDFDHAFQELITAIDTDLDHVRAHTRLLVRAKEWDNKDRNDSFLLRGNDLAEAEQWLAKHQSKEPLPTELHTEYISQSRKVEDANERATQILREAAQTARQRIRIGSVILFLTLMGAIASGIFSQQRILAEKRAAAAEIQRTEREAATITSRAEQEKRAAAAEIRKTEREAATITSRAERNVRAAEVRQEQAEAREYQANQNLGQAQQQVNRARGQAAQARQEQQQAVEERQQARRQVQETEQLLAQRLNEFHRLNGDLRQAQSQLSLIQQDVAASIQDTLRRIEQQTGVKPAIVYISFVQTGDNREEDQLGLWVVTSNGAFSTRSPSATRSLVEEHQVTLYRSIRAQNRIRTGAFLEASQQLYDWMIRPLEETLQTQGIENLVFLMEPNLRTTPMAALHDGNGYLIEKYSLGLMPGLALNDTRHVRLNNANILAMGVSEALENLPALPGVAEELDVIESVWPGKIDVLLNQSATLDNLRTRLQQPFQIVHIAAPGWFTPNDPTQSFVRMWDTRLQVNQFGQLDWLANSVELLVLSTALTGVGDEDFKFGLAGAAIQVGIPSVLANLSDVSDIASVIFMQDFYNQLRSAPIKAEAVRQAQLLMLRGERNSPSSSNGETNERRLQKGIVQVVPRESSADPSNTSDLSHPYYWAGFTLIGNPW